MGAAAKKQDSDWWRGGSVYQIYPRSFFDANNDGVGDLAGITQKLEYVKSLGVDAIWISPFFKSPMEDFGYDVSDYEAIDPIFGTMDDFDALIAKADALDLKVMIDLVMSHTSKEHPWFQESCSSRDNAKADWYVWADPKPDGSPPNNWLSIFGGSSWEWNATRRQYYLHNFLRSQPDLNFHNEDVRKAMLAVAKFWLDKGVKGFRLDTVNFYFHDCKLRLNPAHEVHGPRDDVPDSNPYGMQQHIHDKNQPENLAFLEELRALMDKYDDVTSVGEIGADNPIPLMAKYTQAGKRIHMAYSFSLLNPRFGPAYVRKTIEEHEKGLGSGWPCWAFSNHDVTRVVTRWNARPDDREPFAKVLVALLGSLRGSVCIYQGEELGLSEADVRFECLQDPYGISFWPEYKGRDGCRTPMPWESKASHAGFSMAEPWLPVSGDHAAHAVNVQEARNDSVLHHFRTFIKWRKKHLPLAVGSIEFVDADEPLLAFIRKAEKETILVVLNLGTREMAFDLHNFDVDEALSGHGFDTKVKDNVAYLPKYSACFVALNS